MIVSKEKFLNTLFFLIPISLSVSTLTAELLSLTLASAILFLVFKKDLHFKPDKIIFIYLLLFHIMIFLSALQNTYPDLKLKGVGFMRFFLLYIVLTIYLNNYKAQKNDNSIKIFLILFFFILLDALIQFLFGKNFFGYEISNNRVSGIFGDENILGSFVVKFFPILLWFMAFKNFNFEKNKYLFFSLLFFSFLIVYVSAGRSAFFLMVISISIILILIPNLRKIIFLSLVIFLISTFLINILNLGKTNPHNRLVLKTINQITDYKTHDKRYNIKQKDDKKYNIYIFSENYHNQYRLAFHLFKQNIFFGTGVRGFRAFCRDVNYDSKVGYCSTHPHNTFLQIASELGLVGIFFYILALFFFINRFILFLKNKVYMSRKNLYLISFSIAAIIVNFFPIAPAANFFSGWNSYFNYFSLVLFLFSIKSMNNIGTFKKNK